MLSVRTAFLIAVAAITLTAVVPSCDQPDTCQGRSLCINGYFSIDQNCHCFCENQWEGTTCNECNLTDDDCNNGFAVAEECRCDCDPGWCGSNCEIPVQTCENGGTWSSIFCECDCPDGWAGEVCDSMI